MHGSNHADIIHALKSSRRMVAFGNTGNETLYTGTGNDLLIGNDDYDIVVVTGLQANYQLTDDSGGS